MGMGWTQPPLEPSCFCPPVLGTLSLLHLKSYLEVGGNNFFHHTPCLWHDCGTRAVPTGMSLSTGEISLCPYLPVDNNDVTSVARLIQSDKDLLILNHINIDFPNLSLSGEQMLPQGQIKGHGHLQSS